MSLIEKALAKKLAEAKKPHVAKQQEFAAEPSSSPQRDDSCKDRPVKAKEPVSEFDVVGQSNSSSNSEVLGHISGSISKTTNLVALNVEHLVNHGMITPDEKRSNIKEEFRFIKRKLLKNAFGPQANLLEHPNLIMITSANPNEGKSFSAVNLALSIALEQDKTALLIDADVLRPSVCSTLGIDEPKLGLIDYLKSDKLELSEVIQNTDVSRLKLLSSGSRHHLSSELIGSEKMAFLANELSNRYPDRIIIFDAPPLLGVNESQNLASLVGQILLVVEEDKTTQRDVENAMELLDPDKAIGCILNKASIKRSQLYGYGYGNYN